MKLLCISPTPSVEYAAKMVATARKQGIEPLLYGFNSHHPHGKDYQGTDIVRILTERTDAEFVMGVDAPDVCFLAGEEEILDRLSGFPHPFVVSGERDGVTGLPLTSQELLRQCEADGGYHAQLNIGCWIGRRDYALECFTEVERLCAGKAENPSYSYDNHFQHLTLMKAWGRKEPCEAPAWTGISALCGLGGPEFHIDTHCRIFQSMNKAELDWRKGDGSLRIVNTVTGTVPPVLHYNGDPTRVAFNEAVGRILG